MRKGRAAMVAMPPDQIEDGEAVVVAGDRLTVDQAGAPRQGRDSRDDQRKALGEVVAVAGDKPDTGSVAPCHEPEAIVLDLVNPVGPARRHFGRGRRQGSINPTRRLLRSRNKTMAKI